MTLQGQTIVVMGGSSGIGLATAQKAAQAGAKVVITGRDSARLTAALAQLPSGTRGESVDATDADDLREFFDALGAFHHLVLSISSGGGAGPFATIDVGALRRAFEGKFFAQFQAAQGALRTLDRHGSITFVTAASARAPLPGTSGLAAINGALESMVKTLAAELKPLRVNALSPGIVETPIWEKWPEEQRRAMLDKEAAALPVGRIGRPDEVAEAILLLVTNGFMTGTVLECDGGVRLV
jgi:NAD(P)-dependent dehydrogenase (short-subunit alcohol dehydrogenase family)